MERGRREVYSGAGNEETSKAAAQCKEDVIGRANIFGSITKNGAEVRIAWQTVGNLM